MCPKDVVDICMPRRDYDNRLLLQEGRLQNCGEVLCLYCKESHKTGDKKRYVENIQKKPQSKIK